MPKVRSMVLKLSRSGGVAGIRPPPLELDTARVPEAVRRKVETLVEQAGFFTLPSELRSRSPLADAFQHHLTVVRSDGKAHTVSFVEESACDELRELKRLVREQKTSP